MCACIPLENLWFILMTLCDSRRIIVVPDLPFMGHFGKLSLKRFTRSLNHSKHNGGITTNLLVASNFSSLVNASNGNYCMTVKRK